MKDVRIRHIVIFLLAGVAALAAGYWAAELRRAGSGADGLTELTSFRLVDSEGVMRDVDEWRGKALLINFWATWCAPCREEVPELVAAQDEFADQGLQVLGIAIDEAQPVRRFMEELGFNYPSLIAPTQGMELMARYGNDGALPLTLAFDPEGRLVGRKLGRVSASEIRTFVAAMLEAD